MAKVRQIAQREGRQLSEVVNQLLAEALQRRRRGGRAEITLPRFPMGRPRANLADRNALESLMDS